MRKRGTFSFPVLQELWRTPTFSFLIAVFLCGVLAGSFTGMHITSGSGLYVERLADFYVSEYAGNTEGTGQALAHCLDAFAWPLTALLCGMLAASTLLIAGIVAARGFLLSFSVAALMTRLGLAGVWLSIATTGLCAVITIPCLLLCGTAAVTASLNRNGIRGYLRELFRLKQVFFLCFLLLSFTLLYQLFILRLII